MFYASQLLSKDGVIIIDDFAMASVAKAVTYFSGYPSIKIVAQCERHTPKQKAGSILRTLLPPALASAILPIALYNWIYIRCMYSSMVALKKSRPEEREWDWFCSF